MYTHTYCAIHKVLLAVEGYIKNWIMTRGPRVKGERENHFLLYGLYIGFLNHMHIIYF